MSGQIHWALSLKDAAARTVVRECIKEVVKERLKVLRGVPPVEIRAYQQHVLRLCFARGTKLAKKIVSMRLLPNGDWRNQRDVEVYVPYGMDVDFDDLAEVVGDGLCGVLASEKFSEIYRDRWLGADTSQDRFLRLEAFCGLAKAIYPRFCSRMTGKPVKEILISDFGGDLLEAVEGPNDLDVDIPPVYTLAVHTEPVRVQPASTSAAWVEESETHRRCALKYLWTQPLGRAFSMRQCLEPWRNLQVAKMRLGSRRFDTDEQIKEAKAKLSNTPLLPSQGREYRITVCAKNTIEHRALEQIRLLLLYDNLWEHLMPVRDRNLKVRGLTFRMLSRSACIIEDKFCWRHRQFPIKLFLLIHFPNLWEEFLAIRPCLRGPFFAKFIAENMVHGGISSRISRSKLILLALMLWTDSGYVESVWSSIRRILMIRNVQTSGMDLEELSALYVCDRARIRKAAKVEGEKIGHQHVGAAAAVEDAPRTAKDNSHRGTRWNAWVHEVTMFKKKHEISMETVAHDYHALPDSEKARLDTIGLAAKESFNKPDSMSAFGHDGRHLEAAKKRRLHDARLQAIRSSAVADREGSNALFVENHSAVAAVNQVVVHRGICHSLSDSLMAANEVFSLHQRVARELDQQDDGVLAKWLCTEARDELASILSQAPSLARLGSELQVLPNRSIATMLLQPSIVDMRSVACWVAANPHRSNFAKALLLDWTAKAMPIMSKDCEFIRDDKKRKKPNELPPCHELGYCICCEEGMKVYRLRMRFHVCMKKVFPQGSDDRLMLADAFVVSKLVGTRAAQPATTRLQESLNAARGISGEAVHVEMYWSHGTQSFSPFYLVVLPLEIDGDQSGTMVGEIKLKAC